MWTCASLNLGRVRHVWCLFSTATQTDYYQACLKGAWWPDNFQLEDKFCLNFKIKSVFIQVAHQKWKTNKFVPCFEVLGDNDAYVIYCFIECGYMYHTCLSIWHVFDYFLINTQFWNAKFQDVNEKKRSHLLLPKFQKCWGKSGGQKSDLVKHL